MSAVLTSFVNPNSGYIQSLIQEALKPVLEELRKTQEELRKTQEEMELWKTQFIELSEAQIKNVIFQAPEFNQNVDYALLDSESKVLPRLRAVEIEIGLKESAVEDNKLTLPERIEALEKNGIKALEKPIEEKKHNSPAIPSTSLDLKAVALKDHLQEEVKPNWAGEICLEKQEFYNFMIDKIDEKLRWKPDLRNKREAKKQIFERALEMFPKILKLKKSKSGKHVTGIALKT
jgi:hypothetical protein